MAGKACYCQGTHNDEYMLQCSLCKNFFHLECLKDDKPSNLAGDIYFSFTCQSCSRTDNEVFIRNRLHWFQVISLTLLNLQLRETGKQGYFRWKEHICNFVDKHWDTFFGENKKRSNTWHGTVAGVLSSGCPTHFISGLGELRETGWWRLSKTTEENQQDEEQRKQNEPAVIRNETESGKLRSRKAKTSIEAAMELKQKRDSTQEAKDIRKRARTSSISPKSTEIKKITGDGKKVCESSSKFKQIKQTTCDKMIIKEELKSDTPALPLAIGEAMSSQDLADDISKESWLTEKDLTPEVTVPELLLMDDDNLDSDLEIDPGSITPPNISFTSHTTGNEDRLPKLEDMIACLQGQQLISEVFKVIVSSDEGQSSEDEGEGHSSGESSDSDSTMVLNDEPSSLETQQHDKSTTQRMTFEREADDTKYMPMSVYEERDLLDKLNSAYDNNLLNPELKRYRQKLKIRQIKRSRGMPIFDLDSYVTSNKDLHSDSEELNTYNRLGLGQGQGQGLPQSRYRMSDFRVLDRFQTSSYKSQLKTYSYQSSHSSFLHRLVGTDDEKLQSVISPYSERVLKPFIRRDFETLSRKMKLYQEIIAYPHRHEPSWKQPPLAPIDYCYVQPHHIASVNALCREHFWPGIDLSECLQYPDFSCVTLYKKVVIGFAFMVPEVQYNETYISFIYTHPEWRACGIGTFMLYHLLQTCMGKDVTLHVSATNPAMLLYQKFGFKCEEYILDFYDKYLPPDTRECKHAFFLRLKR